MNITSLQSSDGEIHTELTAMEVEFEAGIAGLYEIYWYTQLTQQYIELFVDFMFFRGR